MQDRVVIFDMDGLMVDTEILHFMAWKQVMEAAGITFTRKEFNLTIGRTHKDTEGIFQGIYGKDFPVNTLLIKKIDLFDSMICERVDTKEGLYPLFEFLEEHGYQKVVATSSNRKRAEYILDKIGLIKRINGLVTGDDLQYGKPDPEIFLKAVDTVNIHKDNAIVLEDSKYGLMSARNAGIRCVFIPDLLPSDEEVRKWAYRVVSSLGDVPEILDHAVWR